MNSAAAAVTQARLELSNDNAADAAAAATAPQARLERCNDTRPLGQWLYAWDNHNGAWTLEFEDGAYQPLSPTRLVLGLVEGQPGNLSNLSLAAIPFEGRNATLRSWLMTPVWSGGGSTLRPAAAASLCVSTTTVPGSAIALLPCKPMPPPQPGGYAGLTQTWYGPGGAGATMSFVLSKPGGGGLVSPSMCVRVRVGNATAAAAAAAEAAER